MESRVHTVERLDDLEARVAAAETRAFRLNQAAPDGIEIELWMSVGSSHTPGYDDAFVDTLVDWLLSQG